MSHTRRRYNLPGHLFWHPWRQHPGWHCRIALRRKRKDEIARLSELSNTERERFLESVAYNREMLEELAGK